MQRSDYPPVVDFVGPSGSGKSRTLIMLGYQVKEKKVPILFLQLEDDHVTINVESCSFSQDSVILVDNAQKLVEGKHTTMLLRRRGKALCLAISLIIVEERGNLTSNCPFQATCLFKFMPFTQEEVETFAQISKRKVQQCVKEGILLPRYISMTSPVCDVEALICNQLNSVFHMFQHAPANLPDKGTSMSVNLINAVTSDGDLGLYPK